MKQKVIIKGDEIKGVRKVIVEVICLLLVLNFFYEGIYKIAYFENYAFWLRHMPFLKPVAMGLNYLIPIGEIVLSFMLLVSRYRIGALYATVLISVIFILYLMSSFLFSHLLFWPYHALWEKPTWMQKMLISLGWAWLALAAIILTKGGFVFKRFSARSLPDEPAKAGQRE
jgi:methylamine utilization protein MauE